MPGLLQSNIMYFMYMFAGRFQMKAGCRLFPNINSTFSCVAPPILQPSQVHRAKINKHICILYLLPLPFAREFYKEISNLPQPYLILYILCLVCLYSGYFEFYSYFTHETDLLWIKPISNLKRKR